MQVHEDVYLRCMQKNFESVRSSQDDGSAVIVDWMCQLKIEVNRLLERCASKRGEEMRDKEIVVQDDDEWK